MRKLSDPARPSKVQIIVAMVCKLMARDGVALATVNGALCRRIAEYSLDSRSRWQRWASEDYQG
jgi:hypothetical protein